jgi:hypothetical protein
LLVVLVVENDLNLEETVIRYIGALLGIFALFLSGAKGFAQNDNKVLVTSPHSCAKGCEFSAFFCRSGVESRFNSNDPRKKNTVNPPMHLAGQEICKEALAACTDRCTDERP